MAHTISPEKRRSRVLGTPIGQLGEGAWTFLTGCGFCQRDRIELAVTSLPCRPGATIGDLINRLICQLCSRPPSFVRLDGPGQFSLILRGPLAR